MAAPLILPRRPKRIRLVACNSVDGEDGPDLEANTPELVIGCSGPCGGHVYVKREILFSDPVWPLTYCWNCVPPGTRFSCIHIDAMGNLTVEEANIALGDINRWLVERDERRAKAPQTGWRGIVGI